MSSTPLEVETCASGAPEVTRCHLATARRRTYVESMKIMKHLPGLPVERALRVLSGRWKMVIVHVLLEGPKRTCELEARIVGIAQKVLIEQLKALEEHGLVERRLFPDEPQRVDYALTPMGESLEPMLTQLSEFGLRHAETQEETNRILSCEAVVAPLPQRSKARAAPAKAGAKRLMPPASGRR